MDSFHSTMFENHCLQAWGDVLRESFACSIAYSVLLPFVAESGSHSLQTMAQCPGEQYFAYAC